MAFALDRLFPRRGEAPYSTAERLVVLVIVRATSFDGSAGDFNCFLSYPTIAKRAGISLASVKRALQKQCDGPAPLLYRSRAGETRGHRHACYRFTLVMHPEGFASARDAARKARREQVDRARHDLQPERIALQRQRRDFGGTLTDGEYDRKLAAIDRLARGTMPARACVTRAGIDRPGSRRIGPQSQRPEMAPDKRFAFVFDSSRSQVLGPRTRIGPINEVTSNDHPDNVTKSADVVGGSYQLT